MKFSRILGPLLLVPALCFLLATVPGCPKKEVPPPPKQDGSAKEGGEPKAKGKAEPLVAKLDGTVKGKVVYEGTPPVRKEIDMKGHKDMEHCKKGDTKDQTWIVGKDNGVANVVVYLEPPAGKFFIANEKVVKDHKHDVVIDQPECVYVPHVVALFPQWRDAEGKVHKDGQVLEVKNASGIGHNTKVRAGPDLVINTVTFPKEAKELPVQGPKQPIDVSCDVHTWMNAKVITFGHPYFAVTDADGNFTIKDVPTGVEVKTHLWHEGINIQKAWGGTKTFKAGEQEEPALKVKAVS